MWPQQVPALLQAVESALGAPGATEPRATEPGVAAPRSSSSVI